MIEMDIYTVGGNVKANGLYISRQADTELLTLCRAGTFAYILSSRQMGKSSLKDRTATKLTNEGIPAITIDLSLIGTEGMTADRWYLGLVTCITKGLNLTTDDKKWWRDHAHLGITNRLTRFFEDVLLVEVTAQIVIFVDEIDTTLNLDFTDDFFAAIRAIHNNRIHIPVFQRLSFVLIGVATPSDLMKDSQRTPFNIGQQVNLSDFRIEEALPLAGGLGLPPELGKEAIEWALEWTRGHPFLTQRLCQAIAEQEWDTVSKSAIDTLVHDIFFDEMSEKDKNLSYVRDMLLNNRPELTNLLVTYRDIYFDDHSVRDDEQSLIKIYLKLSGVVRSENGWLRVRNPIYEHVFNRHWLHEHLPTELTKAIYTVGGSIQANNGAYIYRKADDELLTLCRKGTFAYILSSRQLGKTSMIVSTAERLAAEGIRFAILDLTLLGVQTTAEQWYQGLLTSIAEQLNISSTIEDWWQARAHLGVTDRLTRFFQEVLLTEVVGRIVVFIDEIDTTLGLAFTDDFFAAIRALYDARRRNSDLERLSFVLIGVATPSDLMKDISRTPFNIGQRVEITDFTFEETRALADGLGLPLDLGEQVLKWIMEWTGGHPYLTQRMCRAITEQGWSSATKQDVDTLVSSTFFGVRSERDSNLLSVRTMLLRPPSELRSYVLPTYREIRRAQQPVLDEAQSLVKSHLKLSGVVRSENDVLQVRNQIYKTVFDDRWVKEHLPDIRMRRLLRLATGAITLLAIGLIYVTIISLRQSADAEKQKAEFEGSNAGKAREAQRTAIVERDTAYAVATIAEIQRAQATATVVAAVTAQVAAESTRTGAEIAQANAVTAQVAAESTRTGAEIAQANAVTAQVAAETLQHQAETDRDQAKTQASTAVIARLTAVSQLNQATATVAAAVTAQSAAESQRDHATTAVAAAEAERATAVLSITAAVVGQQSTATALIQAPTTAAQDQATATAADAATQVATLTPQSSFGVPDGSLTFRDNSTEVISPNIQLRNFVAEVQFSNPSSINDKWTYGFIFRWSAWNKSHYRLFVDSSRKWHMQLVSYVNDTVQFTEISNGQIDNIDISNNGSNTLRLVVKNNTAWFFLSDSYIAKLDVSDLLETGYVLIGVKFQQGYGKENQSTSYKNFKVSLLDG